MNKKETEQITEKQHHAVDFSDKNTEELFAHARKMGSARIADLSAGEREALFLWYKENFNALTPEHQTDFLEEFMMHGLIDDSSAVELLGRMSEEQKGEIGKYIGKIAPSGTFRRAFYACWGAIEPDEKGKFIDALTKDEIPEQMVMILPFVSADKMKVETEYKHDRFGRKTEKNILEAKFSDYDTSVLLIESLLEALEQTSQNGYRSPYTYNARRVVEHYIKENALMLLPWADELKKFGLVKEGELGVPERAWDLPYVKAELWLTRHEKETKEAIRKTIRERAKITKDDEYFLDAFKLGASDLSGALRDMFDASELRSAKHLADGIIHSGDKIKDRTKYVLEAIESGYPMFAEVHRMGMDKAEILKLMNKAQQRMGFMFQTSALEEFRIFLRNDAKIVPEQERTEEETARMLIDRLGKNGLRDNADKSFMVNIDRILPEFGASSREKILKHIAETASGLWMHNLKYATEHLGMKVEDILRAAETQENYEDAVLAYFPSIIKRAAMDDRRNKSEGAVAYAKEAVQNIFEKYPSALLRHYNVARSAFPPEEIKTFMDKQLASEYPDPMFIVEVTKRIAGGEFKEYREKLIALLFENDSMTEILTGEYATRCIVSLLSPNEILKLMKRNNNPEVWRSLFSSGGIQPVLEELVASDEKFFAFLSDIEKTGNFDLYADISLAIKYALDKDRKRAKEIDDLKKDIERQKHRFQMSGRVWNKDELRKNVKTAKEEIQKNTGELIAPKTAIALEKASDMLKGRLIERCKDTRHFVFGENIVEVLKEEAVPYILRDAVYFHAHPDALVEQWGGYPNRLKYHDILGKDAFTEICKNNIRGIAFAIKDERFENKLERFAREELTEVAEAAIAANPALTVEKKSAQTYYDAVLEKIRGFSFFGYYEKKLSDCAQSAKKAAHENDEYGEEGETGYFEPNMEFVKLAERVMMLESQPLAIAHREKIISLPKSETEEVFNVLEFLSCYNLDEQLRDKKYVDDFEIMKKAATGNIISFCRDLFEMEENEMGDLALPNTAGIKALSVYFAKTGAVHQKTKKSLQKAAQNMLIGNYAQWRAWGENGKPQNDDEKNVLLSEMTANGLLPKSITTEHYDAWVSENDMSFEDIFEYDIEHFQRGVADILEEALINGHISEELLPADGVVSDAEYDMLILPLKEMTDRQSALKEKIKHAKKEGKKDAALTHDEEIEYKRLQRDIAEYKDAYGDKIARIESAYYIGKLKSISFDELAGWHIRAGGKHISMGAAFKIIHDAFSEKHPDFLQDTERMRLLLADGKDRLFGKEGRITKNKLVLTDRVDAETHILIGETPVPSCQNYDSEGDLNTGLAGIITDPNIKIVQLRDEKGTFIARAVLRLMEDEGGNPKLFMEHIYSVNPHSKIKEAMVKFAAKKAVDMGVDLCLSEGNYHIARNAIGVFPEDKKTASPAMLYSRGSRSAFVYSDAAGGNKRNGVMKITASSI